MKKVEKRDSHFEYRDLRIKPTKISPTCRSELDATSGNEHNPKIGLDLQLDDIVHKRSK